jgi:hypothetical protein
MRQYYASDKKRREEAKRKQQAEKRMKKLNKSQKPNEAEATPGSDPTLSNTDSPKTS